MEPRTSALSGLPGDGFLTMGAIGLQTGFIVALQALLAHQVGQGGTRVTGLVLLVTLIVFWLQGMRRESWFNLS